jgi:hypothetical protein
MSMKFMVSRWHFAILYLLGQVAMHLYVYFISSLSPSLNIFLKALLLTLYHSFYCLLIFQLFIVFPINFFELKKNMYLTGNEVECEQLVWVPKRAGQTVPFNTYIWRRGTIPIWWGAELKITAAEAEIYVSDRDPYKEAYSIIRG